MLKTLSQPESNPLHELYATIRVELSQVEELLATELTSRYEFVNELLAKSNRLSGKRLRPALLLLLGQACGNLDANHIKLAAAIEMVHTATLVHDDILDSADQRRHAKTINCEFGNQVAILTGDFLFSHAFYLTSTLPTTFASQEIGKATNKVCEGEIRQIGTKEKYDISESEYLEIIDAKTAVLCRCAAKLGAFYAGGSAEQVEAAASFGTNLGIAFQIVDDLLDLLGSEDDTGKSLGTDLKQHKPTLPLIHHLEQLNEVDRADFESQILQEKLSKEAIMDRLKQTMSITYAQDKAREYAGKAVSELNQLDRNSAAWPILQSLPSRLLDRNQ